MDDDNQEMEGRKGIENYNTKTEEVDILYNTETAYLELNTVCKVELSDSETLSQIINEYTDVNKSESIVTLEENEDIIDNSITKSTSLEETEFKENKDENYDSYIDDNNRIYRRYRLRDASKKPNYRIPSVNDLPEAELPKVATKREACPQCNQICGSDIALRRHIRTNHKIVYTCSQCNQTFITNAELVNHKKTHETEDRSYLCHKCKQAFSNHCDFLIHQQIHSKQKYTCKCPECGLTYLKKSFKSHIYSHSYKPLNCPICSKECNGDVNLQAHILKHGNKFDCVECGKIMNDKSSFDQHMAIHTGVKLHQCLYCGKAFRLIQQKVVHTRIHTNDKPFKCNKCNRNFSQYTCLKRHENVCYDSKNFVCDICNKRFRNKFNISQHMKVHIRRYKCPECGVTCSTNAGLKVHILYLHSTDRPEVCILCDKRFVNKNQLDKHYRCKSHKNNVFKAENCDK